MRNEVIRREVLSKILCIGLVLSLVLPLFALWGCVDRTITFSCGGGTAVEQTTGSIKEMPITTREGYKFTGWYQASDYSGGAVKFPFTASERTTLYARWYKESDPHLVINQVYALGSTDNEGQPVSHSFVELYNQTPTNIELSSYTIYASSGGNRWDSFALSDSLPPNQSILIRLSALHAQSARLQLDDYDLDWKNTVFGCDGLKVALLQNKGSLLHTNPYDTDGSGTLCFGYEDMLAFSGESAIDGGEREAKGGQTNYTALRRIAYSDTDNNSADCAVIDYRTADLSVYAPLAQSFYDIKAITYILNGGTNSPENPSSFNRNDTIDLLPATKSGYSFGGWYNNADFIGNPITQLDDRFYSNVVLYARWDNEGFLLPVMSITLDNNYPLYSVNRENYVGARLTITNASSSHVMQNIAAEFRGRGNGTWGNEKKCYKIKFANKQELFGEAKSKHWVLHANVEASLMRNNMAYSISRQILDGIEYTTTQHMVDLYVNNSYHGVYTVYESVRVEDGRVEIKSEYNVENTGYLIEYDSYAADGGTKEGINYFRINSGVRYPFTMHSPDPEDYQEEGITEAQYRAQVTYIKNYVQSAYTAGLSTNFTTFTSLVDINSVVDMYIIHEYFKNTDTGWSSFYMYKKPGGKLFFGPTWDFDFTAGNTRGDSSSDGLYVADRVRTYSDYTASELYINLMKQPSFVSLVKARWKRVTSSIRSLVDKELTEVLVYKQSFDKNTSRWGGSNWSGAVNTLKAWLFNRATWLDNWAAQA